MKGIVFDIQHFSVHDGPGIRTTVFLKGCQIRCLWCHNPEGLSLRAHELSFVPTKCIMCGRCVPACPQSAHALSPQGHEIDRSRCMQCGACAQVCPTKALTLAGREAEAAEVIAEAVKDRAYYGKQGGLTISGGEPMMQPDFVRELVHLAKEAGLHVALETNLCYNYDRLDGVRQGVDLFLTDWKETNPELHRKYTGVTNERVLENLKHLSRDGARVLLRCPIIPGYNDREDHFRKIAELTNELSGLVGAELLPYHNLGVSKIGRFGLKEEFDAISLQPPSAETVKHWCDTVRAMGGRLVNED